MKIIIKDKETGKIINEIQCDKDNYKTIYETQMMNLNRSKYIVEIIK